MLEPVVVDGPFVFPHRCVTCQHATGPIVDTHVEIRGYGHVYLCRNCAENVARAYGMVEGDRLKDLMAADKLLHQAEQDLGERDRLIDDLRQGRENGIRKIQDLTERAEQAEGRVVQLENRLSEDARHALELVGGDAA